MNHQMRPLQPMSKKIAKKNDCGEFGPCDLTNRNWKNQRAKLERDTYIKSYLILLLTSNHFHIILNGPRKRSNYISQYTIERIELAGVVEYNRTEGERAVEESKTTKHFYSASLQNFENNKLIDICKKYGTDFEFKDQRKPPNCVIPRRIIKKALFENGQEISLEGIIEQGKQFYVSKLETPFDKENRKRLELPVDPSDI